MHSVRMEEERPRQQQVVVFLIKPHKKFKVACSPCAKDVHNLATNPSPSWGTRVIISYRNVQLQFEYISDHLH